MRELLVRAVLVTVLVAAASVGVLARPGAAQTPTIPAFQRLIDSGIPIYCGGGTGPYVALTFDDGPGPYSAQLLALLQQYGAQATFFEVGQRAAQHPDLVRAEAAAGAVGDHSWSHPYLPSLSNGRISVELARTKRAIRRATGADPILFRPPFGTNDQNILRIARRRGMLEILWNVDSGDGSEAVTPSAQEIYANLVARIRPGAIVLLHEDMSVPDAVNAMKMFLPELQRRGLKAVSVPELLTLDPPSAQQMPKGMGGCHSSWHP